MVDGQLQKSKEIASKRPSKFIENFNGQINQNALENIEKARGIANKNKEENMLKLKRSASHVGEANKLSVHSEYTINNNPKEENGIDKMFLAVNNLAPWKDEEQTE